MLNKNLVEISVGNLFFLITSGFTLFAVSDLNDLLYFVIRPSKNDRFVSGAPGDEKKAGGRKNIL